MPSRRRARRWKPPSNRSSGQGVLPWRDSLRHRPAHLLPHHQRTSDLPATRCGRFSPHRSNAGIGAGALGCPASEAHRVIDRPRVAVPRRPPRRNNGRAGAVVPGRRPSWELSRSGKSRIFQRTSRTYSQNQGPRKFRKIRMFRRKNLRSAALRQIRNLFLKPPCSFRRRASPPPRRARAPRTIAPVRMAHRHCSLIPRRPKDVT